MPLEQIKPNIITSIQGQPKTGKTHLACTWPDPIKIFSFDLGAKPVVAKFPDKQIDVQECPMPIFDTLTATTAGFREFWKGLKDDIYGAIEGKQYQTVVIDTASALWEVIRYAYNEEEGRAVGAGGRARAYGEPNARMYGVLTRAQVGGINLVLINYQKDKWVDDTATGEQVIDGWRRTEGLADIVLVTERIQRVATPEERKASGNTKTNAIKTTVKDCRFDLDMCGFNQENMCYDDLVALLGL